MTTLPSSGTHWIEPPESGTVARVIGLTETAPDVFEFVTTGTAAEIIRREVGIYEIVSEYQEAALTESPAGVFTVTVGGTRSAELVESPSGVFTITPGGTKAAQIFGDAATLYQIVPTADSARATVLAVGSTNILFY